MVWVEDLDFYKNSNNKSFKKAIESMVGSIQWSDLEVENGDIDEAKQIIQSLIITPLTNACDNPDTKLSVLNALCSLFTIDFSKLLYEGAKQQVENFLNIILNALNMGLPDDKKKSIEDLYNAFNLGNYRDTPDKMENSLNSIAGDNQEDLKKLTDYTKDFNQSQAEAWLTATEGSKNADEAIERFKKSAASSPSKLPFDKAWNQLKNNSDAFKDNDNTKDTANNLLELAKAGKLIQYNSGVGGNRTRVQSIFHRTSTSLAILLTFPLPYPEWRGYGFGSFLIRPYAKSITYVVSCIDDARPAMCRCKAADSCH